MSERARRGFSLSLPRKIVAMLDSERGLITRSAYLSNILANMYNIKTLESKSPEGPKDSSPQDPKAIVTKTIPRGTAE
jgi:hypothetical protein